MDDLTSLAAKLFFTLIDLLKGSLLPGFVVFALMLIGGRIRSAIQAEMGWKWLASTLASTLILSWCIFLLAYFYPLLSASQEQGLGLLPSSVAPSLGSIAASFLYGLFKVTVTAAVVSVVLLPLEFVGAYIHSVVDRKLGKKTAAWIKLLVTSYLTTLLASLIILFIIPQSVAGTLYLLYYGFPA